ncbi:MAG TPA: tetratricopeptide repeat protein [Pyrinomonadaceae bacterium]|nr:tetratricopeptide repeat protein [Pyrinomonadaceae bacterium]
MFHRSENNGSGGQSPNQGHSPKSTGKSAARRSHRLTSGGKAVTPMHYSTATRYSTSKRYLILLSIVLVLAVVSFNVTSSAQSQPQETVQEVTGQAELKKGEYESAIKLLTAQLANNTNDAAAQKLLLLAYIDTGRYVEAETSAKKFLLKNAGAGVVRHQLAEVLMLTGRYSDAITEYEKAVTDLPATKAAAADMLQVQLRLAEAFDTIGQSDRANAVYARLVKYYTDNNPQTAAELTPIARALVHLERYQDANEIYRQAIEADSTYLEAQLGAAELFTTKYAYGDAAQFLNEAAQINQNSARLYLDLALNKRLEGGEEVTNALNRALQINPNFVEALALKAALSLEASQFDQALSDIDKATKINPQSLEAHALRASMAYLKDGDTATVISATLAINPRYGEIYNTLAHYATITRRTEQAVAFARKAIEKSPRLWDAHLSLGMALLRLGQMEEGRAAVERAFKGDPFNIWAKNTLDLLDTMKDFRETKRGSFIVKASEQESDVLAPYAANLLEEAAAKLTTKYRFTPKGPVIIEFFQNHEDFAVRTLGMPGLGALGVCFGPLVALDSPSARQAGEFNWGSTLWHEYTHVITLQMTDYRIPRWFSEGLSVYEERQARPGWGDDWNPLFLRSFIDGRWFKISDLDGGFQRPKRMADVPIAYFEASQVCEFIVERYGFDAILRMLALYRDKAQTPDVLRQALKLTEAEFDKAFFAYVETKARPLFEASKSEANLIASLAKAEVLKMLESQDTFALRARAAELYAADGDIKTAEIHFRRAIELYPYFTGEGNAYVSLAKILEAGGEPGKAADVLDALVRVDENNLDVLKDIARLRQKSGDNTRAVKALLMSFYISPFDYALHTTAGELSFTAKNYEQALTEFQVALALQPPNIAEANYNVATAFHALGRQQEAKRSVLNALEAAPRYEKAQELLLRIVGQ